MSASLAVWHLRLRRLWEARNGDRATASVLEPKKKMRIKQVRGRRVACNKRMTWRSSLAAILHVSIGEKSRLHSLTGILGNKGLQSLCLRLIASIYFRTRFGERSNLGFPTGLCKTKKGETCLASPFVVQKSSAVASSPLVLSPPVARTCPVCRSVAVWSARAFFMVLAVVQLPVAGL